MVVSLIQANGFSCFKSVRDSYGTKRFKPMYCFDIEALEKRYDMRCKNTLEYSHLELRLIKDIKSLGFSVSSAPYLTYAYGYVGLNIE